MNSGKHIVLVSPGFPVDEQDTGCIPPLQDYARALRKIHPSARISILALHYPKKKSAYTWQDVNVWAFHADRWGWWSKIGAWLKLRRVLNKLHEEQAIDCVHSFWLNDATLWPQRYCRKKGIRHISTIMGQDALNSNKYLSWIDFSQLRLIALSDQSAEHIQKNTGVTPSNIIPWGIDTEFLKNVNEERVDKDIDILVVSSMIAVKNYPEIIEVIARVHKQIPDLKVRMFGKGPLQKEVVGLIKEQGLENSVDIMGARPRGEVLSAMQNSKLLLHCSRYEGQGYVFLEALANGLPVVTHDVGFLPESKSVYICGTTEEMVDKVEKLLSDKREHAPEFPITMQETVNEYWKIYDQEA